MEKSIRSLAYLFLIAFLSHIAIFAHTNKYALNLEDSRFSINNDLNYLLAFPVNNLFLRYQSVAPAPPTVKSPIYLCQNSSAAPLTATAAAGATLIWYGTSATGGVGSATAPTPSTTTVGQTKYYVSQSDATGESGRSEIVVNVVADNGATILGLRCDPTQILAADRASSVYFDWSNNPLIPNTYNYSYTIQGGSPVSGTVNVSSFQVFGMSPGQSATLTLTSETLPCVPPAIITCTVPCGTTTVTPTFDPIPPFCSGSVAPPLQPSSKEGISGTWSPAVISNTNSGSYVFTPNAVLFPCATTQTLSVTVLPKVTPVFNSIPSTVCQNATAPVLPINSNNTPAIRGTWTPATVNTSVLGPVTYTFTPDIGQCVVTTPTTVTITVVEVVSPTFNVIAPFCAGSAAPVLATTSNEGITGTWSPATIDNTTSKSYLFTPSANQCAITRTISVTVTPVSNPNFAPIAPFCSGDTAPVLANTSPNGITGTWSPTTVSNTASGSYLFTPDAGQCANNQTLAVVVNPKTNPDFNSFQICSGSVPPPLNSRSPNGITGTWNPATVNNTTSGTYDFTPDANQCATSQTINVTVIPSNTLLDFQWTVTEAFAENQILTITTNGNGNYLYQLDNGPVQASPVFENVASGLHSITVNDIGGCSAAITKTNILVIGYPKFFTPNNDTYNDTWNIFGLKDVTGSKIHIFDRYGKLLKEISPSGNGWDGTYNGQPMPGSDYWFVVHYTEHDITKEFKSHFSLKR